jgi:hypothetical protein
MNTLFASSQRVWFRNEQRELQAESAVHTTVLTAFQRFQFVQRTRPVLM